MKLFTLLPRVEKNRLYIGLSDRFLFPTLILKPYALAVESPFELILTGISFGSLECKLPKGNLRLGLH